MPSALLCTAAWMVSVKSPQLSFDAALIKNASLGSVAIWTEPLLLAGITVQLSCAPSQSSAKIDRRMSVSAAISIVAMAGTEGARIRVRPSETGPAPHAGMSGSK